jgi:tRNA-uridine 2-sulfurtransferase
MNKKKILVAMSGGVDSSVAAALLKEEGHEVAGATIRTWASDTCADLNTKACCGLTGVEDARDVATSLGIPYWVFNFEKEFRKHVVDNFASEYMKGRTPNPCVSCNEHIKFRLFHARAKELGYDYIATGHYARLLTDEKSGSLYLTEGKDGGKDQSYVLFPLDQNLLQHLLLPIGGYSKVEIRAKAAEMGLSVASKPDSQEICFIPSNDYGTFLGREFKERTQTIQKGVIRTRDGRVMGEHEGFYHYTRGQRRGLGVAHSERLYVLETIPETNEVIVGTKEEVFGLFALVGRVNLFVKPDFSQPVKAHVKIRSQHQKAPAQLNLLPDGRVTVDFEEPQDAITPGQGAVFYNGARVFGGGWIDEAR